MPAPLAILETSTATRPVRFHLSLNVDDLARSVAFFELLFERAPSKLAADYAKFELDEPALVLSLMPNRAPLAGKLNHLGFRLASAESLVAMQRRLEMAGVATTREDGVECCHSRQTKFWIHDPDGNLWEMYVLEDDGPSCEHDAPLAPARRAATPTVGSPAVDPLSPAPAIWAHRLGEPLPERIFAESESVDEVLLQGTFNARLTARETGDFLAEVARVLKPGGRLSLYQLSARTSLPSLTERLPGLAAAVAAVPSAAELASLLQAAQFTGIHFEKLADESCFLADGVECRETRLVGFKPRAVASSNRFAALYKGPFQQVADDRGQVYPRGQWIAIDAATAELLSAEPTRDAFVIRAG